MKKQWQPGGERGDEVCLTEKLLTKNKTQQETTATRWLSAHYGPNKRSLQTAFQFFSSRHSTGVETQEKKEKKNITATFTSLIVILVRTLVMCSR